MPNVFVHEGELPSMAPDTLPNISFASIDLSGETIVLAVIAAVAGFIVAKILISVFRRMLTRTSILPGLIVELLLRIVSVTLYFIVILIVLATLNVDVGSIVIGLSAIVGIVLGFGMQETFNNFAAGIWIATLRPIDKGEYVEVSGMAGTVQAVGIMATEMRSADNIFITIPNAKIWGSPIVNYSRLETRRMDIPVGISYNSDADTAVRVALDLMKANPAILSDPAPAVIFDKLADSSVNITLRAWANKDDFWTVKWDLTRDILAAYRNAGIEIPFPQMDVHLNR
jgi:small-conductance mechanosensitive channel